MPRTRRWIAVLCILVVLAGALLTPSAGGSTPSVLVALPLLFGLVVIAAARRENASPAWAYLAPAPVPPRAPPTQLSTT